MSSRRILVLALLLSVAIVLGISARNLLSGEEVTAEAKPEPAAAGVMVLTSANTLNVGEFVTGEDVSWEAWDGTVVLSQHFLKDVHTLTDVIGAVVRRPLTEGEVITNAQLVRPGERGFLAAVLRPGMRAVTVEIDKVSGNAGLIFPGDHVDVILTYEFAGKDQSIGNRLASETIMSNLRVIAVDQRVESLVRVSQEEEIKTAGTATLEVTPTEAEQVTVASEIGILSLSLRSLASTDSDGSGRRASRPTWGSDVSRALSAEAAAARGRGPIGLVLMRGADLDVVE